MSIVAKIGDVVNIHTRQLLTVLTALVPVDEAFVNLSFIKHCARLHNMEVVREVLFIKQRRKW